MTRIYFRIWDFMIGTDEFFSCVARNRTEIVVHIIDCPEFVCTRDNSEPINRYGDL